MDRHRFFLPSLECSVGWLVGSHFAFQKYNIFSAWITWSIYLDCNVFSTLNFLTKLFRRFIFFFYPFFSASSREVPSFTYLFKLFIHDFPLKFAQRFFSSLFRHIFFFCLWIFSQQQFVMLFLYFISFFFVYSLP